MSIPQDSLLTRLGRADVVCSDCGLRYGKYSVGCSSVYNGTCDVCGEAKPVTEVRDYGYLSKGINELKGNIKEQSKVVASYMASVGPIMNDDELEDCLKASYEQGEIACMFTEDEIGFLNECLDTIQEHHPGLKENDLVEVTLFESIEEKITTLYDDFCVKYDLSPALKAYNAKYGTWGTESYDEMQRWEGFRDAFVMLQGASND
jgi:hypothetical protein